ncbi:MAG: maleylpyruvate isomerase family mycothiol-dependent enzyme [Acidimicrobiales bacterium]|nr:maleylpyruvate isomerase family mycothiol-dependent enzyme [Acidimicrobiales bacterium]
MERSDGSTSIDNLELAWQSITALSAELRDDEWDASTGCPGWSVKDMISHLIDYEARALGRPAPDHAPADLSHAKNPMGEHNEIGVDARRALPGPAVLDELREVTTARLAQLRALSDDDLARETVTPVGPGTIADMLTLRVMDTWSHEQDVRRAIGRPGHETGPCAAEAVAYFSRFLPAIIGKRAGVADGSVVVLTIGDVARLAIGMEAGRAQALPEVPPDPTVELTMPASAFAALVCGRSDVPDDVTVAGDAAVGEAVLAVLGFMP